MERSIPGHLVYRRAGMRALPTMKDDEHNFKNAERGAHCGIVAIISGFLSRFFQICFELFDSLVKSGIITETLRLESTL